MYTLTKQIAAVLLILGSIRDIRKRSLPVWTLYAVEILVMIWGVWKQEVVWWEIAGGILIGAVFLGISKWTGEALGYADSGLILILGSYLGMWQLMILLLIAFSPWRHFMQQWEWSSEIFIESFRFRLFLFLHWAICGGSWCFYVKGERNLRKGSCDDRNGVYYAFVPVDVSDDYDGCFLFPRQSDFVCGGL